MGEIEALFLERNLLEAHLKHMCFAETVEEVDRLRAMAQLRLDTLYEMKLDEMVKKNAQALAAQNYAGETIILRKDYDYMDQCASSYFRVPLDSVDEISRQIDEEYPYQLYSGEQMEHLIAKELNVEFLAKVWEEDAGPDCSYEPYERQQEAMARARRRGR